VATVEPATHTAGGAPLLKGGVWTLYGPTRSETIYAHQAELMVFRMTGEMAVSIVPRPEGGLLIQTPTKWVFAVQTSK
jgi:hypothetical protein